MNKDVDSLLMPPPPPRLPKRQKTVTVEGADNNNNNIGSSETRQHPDSILIPAAVSNHNNNYSSNNNNNSGDVHSISPKPFSSGNKALTTNSSNEDFFDANENDENATDLKGDNNTQSKSTPLNTTNDSKKNKHHQSNNNSPTFRDIIGHGQAKLRLDEALLPLALPPDLAESVLTGIRAAPASILLHGPPGCGKTKLAKAVAGEAQAAFLSVGPSDILSKFVGESEASIRGLFQEARRKASKMESKCAVVFFDEIDALGRSRVDEDSGKMSQAGGDNSSRRVLAELLIQMTELSNDNDNEEEDVDGEEEYGGYDADGDSFSGRSTISTGIYDQQQRNNDMQTSIALGTQVSADTEQHQLHSSCTTPNRLFGDNRNHTDNQQQPKPRVIVVAATNRPEDCDPALLRRFAVRVLVGLPTRKDRKKIIKRLLVDVEHSITSSQLNELALATEGWSGSDLESMTREAVMAPVRETLRIAAVAKKKAVQQKCCGVESAQKTDEQKKAEDAQHNATRESLLNNFRNLRPVSSKDFEDGIAFFLGALEFGSNDKHAHYDSSSGSEDDMDGEAGEDEEDDKDDEE